MYDLNCHLTIKSFIFTLKEKLTLSKQQQKWEEAHHTETETETVDGTEGENLHFIIIIIILIFIEILEAIQYFCLVLFLHNSSHLSYDASSYLNLKADPDLILKHTLTL